MMKKTVTISLIFSQLSFFLLFWIWIELTNFLHPLVIGIVWFCFSSFVLLIVCWVNKEKIIITTGIFNVIIILYSLGLLILLFFRPKNQSYGTINLIPFETILFYLSGNVNYLIAFYNLAANVGLFIPFGLYYRYLKVKPSFKEILLLSFCSIIIIEGLQFITKRGSLDIDDLILNVAGVCLGFFLQPYFQKVLLIKK
jgi:glycopeptide antibiotics resistance protein